MAFGGGAYGIPTGQTNRIKAIPWQSNWHLS